MSLLGNVKKDTSYLKKIKDKTNFKGHPRHKGIPMQAHHLISAKGVDLSKLGGLLEKLGYNINTIKNLVFLPSTLPGACHLSIQPHRGDHKTTAYDDESAHTGSYHEFVARLVVGIEAKLEELCPGTPRYSTQKVSGFMNDISKKILRRIETTPAQVPLTSIAKYFAPESGIGSESDIGCGGLQNIPKPSVVMISCPKKRDHENYQDGIFYKKPKKGYKLRIGR